jgi:CubicO group peptidase (beta-lactamase class C family)
MLDVTHPCLQQTIANIDRYDGDLMARDGAPEVALAVKDRNGVLLTREYGYADLGARLLIEPATQFKFGSIGKSFTAVCRLQLVEE